MNVEKRLHEILALETVLMALIVASFMVLSTSEASGLHLYELFGGLWALMLTTFGLFKMKQLT